MNTNTWRLALPAAALCALAVAGCVVVPAHPYYAAEPVAIAPPAPRVEVVGVAPYPGYIWIGGYWTWTGQRHRWVPGHWQAPKAHERWVPHRWDHDSRGWHEQPGHWDRR